MSSEQELLEELSRQYAGDGQGYYLAELQLILKGKIQSDITDDHVSALHTEMVNRNQVKMELSL